MKLKYFELDMPYQKNEASVQAIMSERNISYSEAVKIDYEQNWKAKRMQFITETKGVSSLFERLFQPITTKDCWKILVECVSENAQEKYTDRLGVYVVQVIFNFDEYEMLSLPEKNQRILSALEKGVKSVFLQINENTASVDDIVNKIKADNYHNSWIWKSIKKGKRKASIQIIHTLAKSDIYFLIEEKEQRTEKLILSCSSNEWDYGKYLGQLVLEENQVSLIDKAGVVVSQVSV